jgi:hypothetical protein
MLIAIAAIREVTILQRGSMGGFALCIFATLTRPLAFLSMRYVDNVIVAIG